MNKIKWFLPVLILALFSGFVPGDSDIYFRINKSIDLFGKVYREITLNYVDEVNPEEFMLAGIKGMLGSLDPYTVYIDETHKKDFDIMTTGKYGGIGATVGLRDDKATIIDLLEGYSAQRQGMRIGDVIIKIDSVEIDKNNYSELGLYLKKEPGKEIKITVEREGEREPIIFNLFSEEIEIKNLSYYSFFPEGSGNAYLKLSGFTRTAGEEIKKALMELGSKRDIESIVLDLRGNPGGLLDAAIDVCEKFLPQKSVIVSVKGRDDASPKIYYSAEEPVAKDKKLVVLINGSSASASEIVAGAIQDHDRGVIVGDKSFGKGLVQTIVPLSFNTSLKLTTARYYTPSGRSIQKIDYSENSKIFENHETNKQTEFSTDHNRVVTAGGGIIPDSLITNKSDSYLVNQLIARGYFFKFATMYFNKEKFSGMSEIDNDKLFGAFIDYLKTVQYEVRTKSERLLDDLEDTFGNEFTSAKEPEAFSELAEIINEMKTAELNSNKERIIVELKKELAARISGRKGRVKESLLNDNQFDAAYWILTNDDIYKRLLNIH